jgi:hypothetical protein
MEILVLDQQNNNHNNMKYLITLRKHSASVLVLMAIALISSAAFGQTRPDLGTASTYAVFTGGGAINNTGLSVLTGDVGQAGAYAFNGFPPGTYTGTLNRNNSAAALAKSDLATAQTVDAAVACGFVLGVGIVDGQSFSPGVYCSGAASTTSGHITFDAGGNPSAIFIVKIGGALSANSGTHILLANGARAANIYWFVDGQVTVGDSSNFAGTIIANGAILFYGKSSLNGRALASPAGAISLSANNMSISTDTGSVNNKLTVIKPAQGDSIQRGLQHYQITWSGTGIARKKTIQYSLDSGATWALIATISNDSLAYSWNVPDTVSIKAVIRVTDTNNLTGRSGIFKIVSSKKDTNSSIVVVHPTSGEVIAGGTANYLITWTGSNVASFKTIEYSLDGGTTWNYIGTQTGEQLSYSWANVPNEATTQALIRITDANNVSGSSGSFTITRTTGVGSINSLTLTGLNNARNIGNNHDLGIAWTFTPDIGTSVEADYSLDQGLTWVPIVTIPTTESPATSWMTTSAGYYNPVFIRITSSEGMTATSEPFSIGSIAGVSFTSYSAGYSLANYPNPVSSKTHFAFVLPIASDVTIAISDESGREVAFISSQRFAAGAQTIPFDASKLADGAYTYTLRAGTTTLAGRMTVVK